MRKSIKIPVFGLVLLLFGFSAFADERGAGRMRQNENIRAAEDDSGRRARDAAAERIRDIERRREHLSEQFKEERERVRELVTRHRRALTEAEKSALESELKELLEEGFRRRHAALQGRLQHLREECERIESRIKENLENRDEIIERRLERLLQEPGRRGDSDKGRNRGRAAERDKR